MMLTALHCRRLGITFAAVHDSYWTHACEVDLMNKICREQFVLLHSEQLVKQCAEVILEIICYCCPLLVISQKLQCLQSVHCFFFILVFPQKIFAELVTYCYADRRIPGTAENIYTNSSTRNS